jgi:radical SAM enzyme (TIGR01210 family)
MNELAKFCKQLKKDFKPKIQNPKKPVHFWSEKDVLNGKIAEAFVIIFRTQGCSWALKSGCSMCGYFNDSMWQKISDDDLLTQFNIAMNSYSGQKFVKIFTSGSFLDDREISPRVRNEIIDKLSDITNKISVESRPEYITDKTLSNIKKNNDLKNFEIGIGLETVNDSIRNDYLNKGFTFDDYKNVANILKKHNMSLKTYVLIKPPFLTEKESIDDAIKTIDKIKKITGTVSFNPTNVQRKTFVNYLWQRKKYRPAWLFSVVEILKESKKIAPDVFIKCDISGGGSIRGAHNCKVCDRKYLNAITDFSLNQNTKVFEGLDCECKEKWLDQLDIEGLSYGSIVDI